MLVGGTQVMLITAGIGLTPAAAVIRSILLRKWKKNYKPHYISFYWMVRQDEIESFQWFVQLLAELEANVNRDRAAGNVDPSNKGAEIHIYVTRAKVRAGHAMRPYGVRVPLVSHACRPPSPRSFPAGLPHAAGVRQREVGPGAAAARQVHHGAAAGLRGAPHHLLQGAARQPGGGRPQQPAGHLGLVRAPAVGRHLPWGACVRACVRASLACAEVGGACILTPTIARAPQIKKRMQDIYEEVGVCFCGAEVIGKDLARMCAQYSTVAKGERFMFHLHKENF